jgi:ATP synthase protein I
MLKGKSKDEKEKKEIVLKKDQRRDKEWMEYVILVTQLGLTVAGSILFCFAVGHYLDKWLHTKGVFTAIFIIFGVIGGGYTAYRQILDMEKEAYKWRKKRG